MIPREVSEKEICTQVEEEIENCGTYTRNDSDEAPPKYPTLEVCKIGRPFTGFRLQPPVFLLTHYSKWIHRGE